jgi:hypothetical protein
LKGLVSVLSFAIVYGCGAELTNRVSTYYFGFWDPKFHDQAGNVAVFHQLLPVFVGFASLSFVVGWLLHRTAIRNAAMRRVAAAGALSGAVASLLLLSEPALRRVDGFQDVAAVVGMVSFWAGPASCAALAFMFVRLRSGATAV